MQFIFEVRLKVVVYNSKQHLNATNLKFTPIITSNDIDYLRDSILHKGKRYFISKSYQTCQLNYKKCIDEGKVSLTPCILQVEMLIYLSDININFVEIGAPATKYVMNIMEDSGV